MRKTKPYVDPRQEKLWPNMHANVYGIGRTWKENDSVNFFGDFDLDFLMSYPVRRLEQLTRTSLLQSTPLNPVEYRQVYDLTNNETGE